MSIADDLDRFASLEENGAIAGVRISSPKPWEPARAMLALRAKGRSVDEIAKATGYSTQTVERNLQTGGVDRRIGPQCSAHGDKVFTVAEAKASGLLPCKPECICRWSQAAKWSR